MEKPVVAAVNGVAAGAGASLAFACDLRIVVDTAGFNLAFANVALSCDTGSRHTPPRLPPAARGAGLRPPGVPGGGARLGRARAGRPAGGRADRGARLHAQVGRLRRLAHLRGGP